MSENDSGITRTFLSASHRDAIAYLRTLMQDAGMQVHVDALANLVGRYPGRDQNAPVIMTGSHQDSVVNAGRYDGLFGILSPIAAIHELNRRQQTLERPIEVVAFGDEEGVRFDVTMLGSAAMAGRFDPQWLERKDSAGISMREAMLDFGCAPDEWQTLKRDPQQVHCFIESHIEQGPVLLNEDLAVGVVTAIAGVSRVRVRVLGLAGHAGTVPMPHRRDALTAAAAIVLAAEALARTQPQQLVATTGRFAVAGGGAINVIPGEVSFTLDIRSGDDATRLAATEALRQTAMRIATERDVTLEWEDFFSLDAAPCDAHLQDQLARVIAAHGQKVRRLPSGAGHDAMKFSGLVPIAMLFVRCGNGGISHNPLETMTAEDAEIATAVLQDLMIELARAAAPPRV